MLLLLIQGHLLLRVQLYEPKHYTSTLILFLFHFLWCLFLSSSCMQSFVTQINHAIGAEGYVSFECKNIVHNYGDSIWEFITSGVCSLSLSLYTHSDCLRLYWNFNHPLHVLCLQLRPEIICVDIGLCSRNGTHRTKYNIFCFPH